MDPEAALPSPAWIDAWAQARPVELPGPPPAGRTSVLAGVRILDLSRLLPGPMAARYLADLGAQVLKIEPPVPGRPEAPGDDAADIGPDFGDCSAFYQVANAGKRRLALDLKQPPDMQRLHALVADAHAVIEGFRPGVMARLGLDFAALTAINPAIVLTSISGYGQDGSMRLVAGHDINYLALAGALDQNRATDGRPAINNLQVADLLGGAQTAAIGTLAGIVGGLLHRRGCHIDVSMTHAVQQHLLMAGIEALLPTEDGHTGPGLLAGGVACYNVYRTRDGQWMAVGALEHKFWRALCEAISHPAWADDHWSLGQQVGGPQAQAQIEAVAAVFASRTQAEWVAHFSGHDCCVTPVLDAGTALFGATASPFDVGFGLQRLAGGTMDVRFCP